MEEVDQTQNPYAARFKQFLVRSASVAQQRIAAEGRDAPISDAARDRAQNVLSYALKDAEVWAATRDLLLTMAPKMEMAGYRRDWLPYLEQGVMQSEVHYDRHADAELHLHMGHLHRLQSQFDTARTLLTTSATAFAELGERAGQARALNQLAYVAWQQHEHAKVQALAHQALALLDETDVERAMSLSALGLSALEQHQWEAAETYHRSALQIRTAHGDRRQMAWSLQNLARTLQAQGKHTEAIPYYEDAILTLGLLNDRANCAIVQMNLGVVYWLQGEFAKAVDVYAVAESTFREFGDESNLAKVLTCKGLDYLALQNWKGAEEAFLASSDLFQKLSDTSEYLNALDGLGITYLEQGYYDQALAIFESIFVQLPQIVGTRTYPTLTNVISGQLERAKVGKSSGLNSA